MEDKKDKTLKECINENYHLITVLGVFGALSGIFASLNLPYLSFLSYGIILLIALELFKNIPYENKTFSLIFFDIFLLGIIITLFIFLVLEYKKFVINLLPLFFFAFYIFIISVISRKYLTSFENIGRYFLDLIKSNSKLSGFIKSITKKIPAKWFNYIILIFVVILLLFPLLYISSISGQFVGHILNEIDYDRINGTFSLYNSTYKF